MFMIPITQQKVKKKHNDIPSHGNAGVFLGILEQLSGTGGNGCDAFLAWASISSISAQIFSDESPGLE